MAVVDGHISYQLIDGNNIPWAHQLFFTCSTGLLADIIAFADAYAPVLDAVTQSYIDKMNIVVEVVVPGGIKTSPVAKSNGNIGALLNYKDNGTIAGFFSYWIPNWIPAGFQDDHPQLVFQNDGGAVEAYLAFLLAAHNNTQVVTEDNVILSELKKATKSDRKKRKAMGLLR